LKIKLISKDNIIEKLKEEINGYKNNIDNSNNNLIKKLK
jgi:hypothetical protein